MVEKIIQKISCVVDNTRVDMTLEGEGNIISLQTRGLMWRVLVEKRFGMIRISAGGPDNINFQEVCRPKDEHKMFVRLMSWLNESINE